MFRRVPAPRDDWYERAKPEELREYNAFGPWIQEIRAREEMPPVFLPWYSEFEHSSFLLKIPINRERRDARPGQNLYQTVLAIEKGRLGFLTLGASQRVECRVLPWEDILALRNFHVLLRGEFRFFLKNGSEEFFPYNAVSLPLVERVLDFLSSAPGQAAGRPVRLTTGWHRPRQGPLLPNPGWRASSASPRQSGRFLRGTRGPLPRRKGEAPQSGSFDLEDGPRVALS